MIHNHTKEEALKRLTIIEGHLKKVKKMVESEDYYPLVRSNFKSCQF